MEIWIWKFFCLNLRLHLRNWDCINHKTWYQLQFVVFWYLDCGSVLLSTILSECTGTMVINSWGLEMFCRCWCLQYIIFHFLQRRTCCSHPGTPVNTIEYLSRCSNLLASPHILVTVLRQLLSPFWQCGRQVTDTCKIPTGFCVRLQGDRYLINWVF